MRYYFICNWKMNPAGFDKARSLLGDYNKLFNPTRKEKWLNKKIIVCPPFVYFQLFDEDRNRSIRLGSQNIFWKSKGNYTGQVSARMVRDFGAEYVLIGHSELREAGDNEIIIKEKIKEALKFGITPVVCLGYGDYVKELLNIINNFSAEDVNKMIIAYEPVSAVGTGNFLSHDKLNNVIRNIKRIIYRKFRRKFFSRVFNLGANKSFIPHPAILYGGSVNVQNYKKYLNISDLSGFVLGRESLEPKNVKEIITGFGGG